jgi:hypothetical protein
MHNVCHQVAAYAFSRVLGTFTNPWCLECSMVQETVQSSFCKLILFFFLLIEECKLDVLISVLHKPKGEIVLLALQQSNELRCTPPKKQTGFFAS